MSLSSEIRANKKKNNSNETKQIIKNTKLMNVIRLSLFLTLLIADIFYIIKENIIGISNFTNTLLIISIILEGLIFVGLLFLRFNTEIKFLKVTSTLIYAIPIIAYVPMMTYGDGFSIILFLIRIVLIGGLLFLATRDTQTVKGSRFVIKQIGYIFMVAVIFVVTFILLISSQTRRVVYSYDDAEEGYVVKNVLKGYSDVEFKEGTIKISDNSLTNAGDVITIPSSVVDVSKKAFVDSEVKEIHLNSSNITIISALLNSNVEKVYVNDSNLVINDLSLASRKSKFKFYLDKDSVDEYREKYRKYDYLFVPKCDDGELYVAYNNTSLPIEYYKDGDLVNAPNVPSTNEKRFKDWNYAFNVGLEKPTLPLNIHESLDLFATWNKVYKISLEYNGGTVTEDSPSIYKSMPNSIYVIIEDGDVKLPTLQKSGYRFDGWYYDDNQLDDNKINASEIDDMFVGARFSRIFKLKYHENGGYIPDTEKNQEYVDGDYIIPATPERLGYEFDGWYDNAELQGNRIEVVNNYNIDLYAKWKLVAPVLTVSNDINKVYDNDPIALSVDINHPLINDDDFSISYKWYKNDDTKVISTKSAYNVIEAQNNKYYCHITIKHLGNTYELDSDYINVNIEKAEYDLSEITFDNYTFKYEFNGKQQMPKIEAPIKGKDGIAVVVQYSYAGNFIDVDDTGTVTATFTTDSNNYIAPASMTAKVEIIRKKLEVVFDSLSFVYDGNAHKPVGTLVGVIDGYPVELTYPTTVTTDVNDDYKLYFNITDYDHYNIDDEYVVYEITKADYDLSNLTFDNTTFDYDGTTHLPTPTNLVSGLILDTNNSIGVKYVKDTKVTLYFINSNPNYNDPSSIDINVIINPKTIDISLNTTEFTYNGNVLFPNSNVDGLIDNDEVEVISLNNSINFGTYIFEFELQGKDKDNYVVSNSSYNLSYVIKRATYDLSDLTFNNQVFDYDGTTHLPTPVNLPEGLTIDVNNSVGAINVSDTKVTLHFINTNSNYNTPSDMDVNVTISPKKIIVNVIESNLTYQKKLLVPEYVLDGRINNDIVDINILNTDSIDVGNYTLKPELTGSDKANYVIDEFNSNLDYSIGKADFDIQYVFLENTIYEYDGSYHHPTLDLVNGKKKYYTTYQDEITIEYIEEYKNAGSYSVEVEFSVSGNSSNYVSAKRQSYNLTITKKEVTLEFDSLLFMYSEGTLHKPEVSNIIGMVTGDDITISVSNNDITEVGEYELRFTYNGSASGNYIVNETYKAIVVGEQKTITGFTINDYVGTYDGKEHTITVTGLEEGITAVFDKKMKDVCQDVDVKITFESSDPNVGITTVAYGKITINPKPITVEFDTTTNLIYNGENQIPNATLTGVVEGDIVNIIMNNASVNAGTYNAIASLDNSNYTISNSNELTYTIEKCHVSLVWGQLDLVYSKSALKPTAKVKYNGEELDTIVNIIADSNINVGTYAVTAELEDNNYIIDGSPSTTYNIIAKPISLEWSNKTLTYNGKSQAPTATVTTIIGDNCTVNISGAEVVPGIYTATASLSNLNYVIDGSDYTSYIINKGVLTEDECNNVDYLTNVVYDGNLHGPNIEIANRYTNDKSLIMYRYNGKKNADQYYIDVEFYTENGYYEPLIVSVALVISPLELSIVLNETELRFNNNIVVPTFTILNKVDGDDIEVTIANTSSTIGEYVADFSRTGADKDNYKITNTYTYSIIKGIIDMTDVTFENTDVTYNGNQQLPTSANLPEGVLIDTENSIGVINTTDTVATVKFALSGQIADNYEVPADINVNMTVSKKLLAISWLTTVFGYDGNKHKPTYELVGVADGDIVELVFDSEGETNQGTYTITAASVTNNNYNIEEEVCEYEITRGTYDMSNVSISDKTFIYDGKSHNNAISIDQSELPDGVTAEFVYDTNPIYVGKYKVTIKFTGDSYNYDPIPNMEAYVIINPLPVTVEWSNTSFTYNGSFQAPTASITSTLIGSDVCEVSITGAKKDAGTYTATAVLTNSNYVASIVEQEYTISPYVLSVTVYCDTKSGNAGTTFNYMYDGLVHNNLTATFDESKLIGDDDLVITVNTSTFKANAGTYSYTLSFSNNNYRPTTYTGAVVIKKLELSDSNFTMYVTDGVITGEYTLSDYKFYSYINYKSTVYTKNMDAKVIYYYIKDGGNRWTESDYVLLDGEPTVAGTYYVTIESTNTDNITISHNSIWSLREYTFTPINTKEIWSIDGQYNSNLFTATGNQTKTSATFNIDNETVTFTRGLKLETNGGTITFTISSEKTLTIYSMNGQTVKINDTSYSVTSGSGTEITLEAGTYTIAKGNGATVVYALTLE